jgi:hypothetical protein
LGIQILSMTKYANTTETATAIIASSAGGNRQDARADCPITAALLEVALAESRIVVVPRNSSGDSSGPVGLCKGKIALGAPQD